MLISPTASHPARKVISTALTSAEKSAESVRSSAISRPKRGDDDRVDGVADVNNFSSSSSTPCRLNLRGTYWPGRPMRGGWVKSDHTYLPSPEKNILIKFNVTIC